MEDVRAPQLDPSSPLACQIRIVGHLGGERADWFEGVTVTAQDSSETLLSGQVADQVALHGLLKRVRDLGIPLLSVVCAKAGPAQAEVVDIEEAQRAHAEEEK
jgi:hypothetical protein